MLVGAGLLGVLLLAFTINISRSRKPHRAPKIQYKRCPSFGLSEAFAVSSCVGLKGELLWGEPDDAVDVGSSFSPDTEILIGESPISTVLELLLPPAALKTNVCFLRVTLTIDGIPQVK